MTWKRVVTALVLIPIVVALVLFAPTFVVGIATGVFTVLALWEYFALGDAIGHRAYRFWTIFCSLLLIAQLCRPYPFTFSVLTPRGNTVFPSQSHFYGAVYSPTTIFLLFVFGLACLTLWTRRPLVESLPASGVSASALLVVAFPLSFAVRLQTIQAIGPRLLLFALVITWAADTTAYFVGRGVGRHPLAPHISPKKTWEGSIGSMFGSLLVAYAFSYWIRIPLPHLLAMAALGNIAGQIGDLVESAYKRSAGVKDSGGLLPGHGGILDRIDALILCFPVIWYYLVLVNPPIL
jgi:phosphatidate cytidylyltransferase